MKNVILSEAKNLHRIPWEILRAYAFRITLCTSLLSFDAIAQQGPFPIRTQQPIYLQTVTILPSRAKVLPTGALELRVDSAYSNLYERETNATYDINLDMELWRLAYVVNYGFAPNWEVGLEIPTLHFDGGFLDGFIQDYHNTFGFPNGGRNLVANGTFNHTISRNGQPIYSVGSQSLGVGDLTLNLKNQILEEGDLMPALGLTFAMKFPSGDADLGLGSGNVGFGLGTAFEKSWRRLHGYLNLNYLVDGGNERLGDLMVNEMFDFSLAGEVSFSKKVSGLVQLVGGTPRLKGTGLETWDGVPLDLILGARGNEGKFFWQAAFSEDVRAVGPSVDFTAWISTGIHFGAGGS